MGGSLMAVGWMGILSLNLAGNVSFGVKNVYCVQPFFMCIVFFLIQNQLLTPTPHVLAFLCVLHPAADKTISHFLFCIAFVAVFITQTIHLSIHHVSAQ
jgi:hypothetical protein